MYLSDTKIQELIDSDVLLHADASNIGQVTYDLRTDGFYINENKQSEVELGPGDSTFVSCVECVALPNDLTASVLLRNSRIRQGIIPTSMPGNLKRSRTRRKKSSISSPVSMATSWPSSPFSPRSLRS